MSLNRRNSGPSFPPVRLFVSKLLALIAVLLMPLSMAASATPAAHHAEMNSEQMQHCPEQSPKHHGKAGLVECTMACSAALPAMGFTPIEANWTACVPVAQAPPSTLHGLHPETATPPPKES